MLPSRPWNRRRRRRRRRGLRPAVAALEIEGEEAVDSYFSKSFSMLQTIYILNI